jgi:hypothetical protein
VEKPGHLCRPQCGTTEGLALFGADLLLRGESAWAFANLYLDFEEYLEFDWPGDALIAFEIAKDTWFIRRLNEAAHQILLIKFSERGRKYLAQNLPLQRTEDGALPSERHGLALIRELEAAGVSPNLVLAEVLHEIAATLNNFDWEIDRAFARRLDNVRLLTRLRSKRLMTERHRIQGAGYSNRGDNESWSS